MPEANSLPTDFDDEILETESVDDSGSADVDGDNHEQVADELEKPVQDENGIPYCLKHHCKMKQSSGGKRGAKAAYYSCPVKGCDEKGKRIKTATESSIPSEPQSCPRCSQGKKLVVLERHPKHSSPFYTILACPNCGHKSQPMPRPEFVAAQQRERRRGAFAGVGDR